MEEHRERAERVGIVTMGARGSRRKEISLK